MSDLLNYKQQASEPTWFNQNDDHYYHSVTSGSSPFNEWYEFATEDDALEFALTFESQSVVDHYCRVTVDGKERWYQISDVVHVCHDKQPLTPLLRNSSAIPASFADLAEAESRF